MKRIIILMILIICVCCTACSSTSGIIYEIEQDNQTIEIGSESYNIPFIQITNCTDKQVQEKANGLLRSVIYDIVALSKKEWSGLKYLSIEVMCQTSEYFSLVYEVKYDDPGTIKHGSGHIGVTINMKTGERVFLSDLIKDVTELYGCMQEFNSPYEITYVPPSLEEAEKILIEASLNETDYIAQIKESDQYVNIYSCVFGKPTFYVTDTELVIIRDVYLYNNVHLPLPRTTS